MNLSFICNYECPFLYDKTMAGHSHFKLTWWPVEFKVIEIDKLLVHQVNAIQCLCLLYIITRNFVTRKWMQVVTFSLPESCCMGSSDSLVNCLSYYPHMLSVLWVFFTYHFSVSYLLLYLGNIIVLLCYYSIIGVLNVLLYSIIYKLSFLVPFYSYFLPFSLSYPGA